MPVPVRRPFSTIVTGSIARQMEQLHQTILLDNGVRSMFETTPSSQLISRAYLKVRVTSRGRLRLRSLYWSLQTNSDDFSRPFRARTLRVDSDQTTGWYDFPEDPDLKTAPLLMSGGEDRRVLQYIPFRRLTVLEIAENKSNTVLKLKRPERLNDACERLKAVNSCIAGNAAGFSIPENLSSCLHSGAQRQTYRPGRQLARTLSVANAPSLIHELGERLSVFHSISGTTLPAILTGPSAETDPTENWLCAMWPSVASRIQKVFRWLDHHRMQPLETTLCHGDLSPDQILIDQQEWSLVDMDHAHGGDAIQDLSRLLVRLYGTVPQTTMPASIIRQTLLRAYGWGDSGAVNSALLNWHCCLNEMRHLSTLLSKDIGSDAERAACLNRAECCCQGSIG